MIDINELFSKPVKRNKITQIFGCSDREARRIIAELQNNYNIINLSNGSGYVIGNDEQIKQYCNQEMKRALKSFNKARKMLSRIENGNDKKIYVKSHYRRIKKEPEDKNQIKFI